MEYVQLCRICGHINPAEEIARCRKCLSFSGLTTVPRPQGERVSRRTIFGLRVNRWRRLSLILLPIAALVVWSLWDFLDLAPNPPRATTNVEASLMPQMWPQARRTPQNTGFVDQQAPVPQMVKWTYATARPLTGSPAVANGRVFLSTEDGRALAFDQDTGQVKWEYHSGLPSGAVPSVAGELVYITLRPGSVVALEQETGTVRWQTKLDDPILASPIVVEGTLYIGSADSKLYAIDAATGKVRWTFETSNWITSPIAYSEGNVILTSQGSSVHVIDATTGRQRLVYDTGRGRSSPGGAAVQGNLVYFGTFGGRVWAIDLRARTYPWDRNLLFWKTNFYVWGITGSPPVQRGSVWSSFLGGDITKAPAIAHDTVYVSSVQGKVGAFDAMNGEQRWVTELDSKITAAPTVAGDTLLIGTEKGSVFGLDVSTGKILWEFETGAKIAASPVVAGDTIYIASHDGNLYAVTESGKRP